MRHTHCADCQIPLRTQGMDAAKMPGTRLHAAKGRCGVCYGAIYERDPLRQRKDRIQPPTLASLMAEKEAFEAARRKRGVPPEGLRGGRYLPVDA